MLEDNAFPFQAEGQVKIIDIFTLFILDRISPSRNCCEIMAQRDTSEPNQVPQTGFLIQ